MSADQGRESWKSGRRWNTDSSPISSATLKPCSGDSHRRLSAAFERANQRHRLRIEGNLNGLRMPAPARPIGMPPDRKTAFIGSPEPSPRSEIAVDSLKLQHLVFPSRLIRPLENEQHSDRQAAVSVYPKCAPASVGSASLCAGLAHPTKHPGQTTTVL